MVLQAKWEGKRGAGEKRRKNFGGGAKGVNKKQWRRKRRGMEKEMG